MADNMKLLIADDNPAMRALLRQICSGVTAEVRDCASGTEVVALFKEFQPDLTLMDLVMPGMDGLTATTKIKTAFPNARSVIITQRRGPEYHETALQVGAVTFMLKDDLHTLPHLLVNALTHSKL